MNVYALTSHLVITYNVKVNTCSFNSAVDIQSSKKFYISKKVSTWSLPMKRLHKIYFNILNAYSQKSGGIG